VTRWKLIETESAAAICGGGPVQLDNRDGGANERLPGTTGHGPAHLRFGSYCERNETKDRRWKEPTSHCRTRRRDTSHWSELRVPEISPVRQHRSKRLESMTANSLKGRFRMSTSNRQITDAEYEPDNEHESKKKLRILR
jgi:hypothetical protein